METIDSGNHCFPSSLKEEEIKYLLHFHLSVLTFILIPLGNIIIPMIIWLSKRDKNVDLKNQVTDLLNFQILWTLLFFAFIFTFALLNTLPEINNWIPLYIAGFLFLLNIIYTIVVSILISKNILKKYYYPLIKFIKL